MLRVAGALRAQGHALKTDAREAEWLSIDAVKAAAEKPVARVMAGVWQQQREEVLRGLDATLEAVGASKRGANDVLVQALLDLGRWNEALKEELEPGLLDALEEGFRTGAYRVNLESTYQATPRTSAVLEAVLGKANGINQTTVGDVADAISKGLRENESIADIRRRVEGYFDGISEWRAQLIAQTSVTPAFETAQQEAFRAADIEKNGWFSQRDGQVRPDHYRADGQVREIGTAFDVGEAKLEFPGDPAGPARQTIACRCTLFPVLDEDDEQKRTPTPDAWRAQRNAAMRAAYPSLRDDLGKWSALDQLAGEHSVSPATAEDIVYKKGHYST